MTACAIRGVWPWLLFLSPVVGCGSSGEVLGEPPPIGTPYLATRLRLSASLLSTTCTPGGSTFRSDEAMLELSQDGSAVVAILTSPTDEISRDVRLRGCVAAVGDDRFVLRLGGVTAATELAGRSACTVQTVLPIERVTIVDSVRGQAELQRQEDAFIAERCELPDTPDFPVFELKLCTDGSLRGDLGLLTRYLGAACGETEDCESHVRWRAVPLSVRPDQPNDALRGGPCERTPSP
ncbi:MAG: hypothetical protein EXR76_16505 [Myxococcales bacterium]|nr:hypothetical protein [Myxococcales bacterium]